MGETIGYCRVSTDGQTLNDQIAALKAAGASKIFAEKQSGARSDRPRLRTALSELGRGGVLMVTRLDRLARSTRELLTCCTKSASVAQPSSHWPTHGPTPPPRTNGA